MIEENQRVEKTEVGNSNSGKKTPPPNNNKQKSNRRSLFSVLFNKSSSSSSSSSSSAAAALKMDSQEQSDSIEKLDEDDENSELKLIIKEDNNNNDFIDKKDKLNLIKEEEEQLENSEKSQLIEKQIDDTDSYVLDLNSQVANEKFKSLYDQTVVKNHKQQQLIRISKSVSPTTGNRWHENDNYIPSNMNKNNLQQQFSNLEEKYDNLPINYINNNEQLQANNNNNNGFLNNRSKSPLLEEFFERHKLQFPLIDSDNNSNSSENLTDSDSYLNRNRNKNNRNLFINNETVLRRERNIYNNNNISTSDRDLRLLNWHLMATARTPKQLSLLSDGKCEQQQQQQQIRETAFSDSELEDEFNCHSPALVVTCSDDTSCSSVELIWTPRNNTRNNNNTNIYYQINNNQLLNKNEREKTPSINNYDNQISSIKLNNATLIKTTTKTQTNISNGQKVLQKLSIFELAKPIRAKGKRFGLIRNKDSIVDKEKKKKIVRDKISPDHEWVANPIFTTEDEDEDEEEEEDEVEVEVEDKKVINENIDEKKSIEIEEQEFVSAIINESSNSSLSLSSSGIVDEQEENNSSKLNSINSDDDSDDDCEKIVKKNRWSFRRKRNKSIRKKSTSSESTNGNNKSDNNYLNHFINLDKKIKTNVFSIKSQLSNKFNDTSKRASVLADQLITSIKDTTKDQLSFANSSWNRNNNNLTNSMRKKNSFNNYYLSSSSNQLNNNQNDLLLINNNQKSFDFSDKKSKQFSLIYMHQQQSNGQQVITKQPLPIKSNKLPNIDSITNSKQLNLSQNEIEDKNLNEKVEKISVATMTAPLRPPPPTPSSLLNRLTSTSTTTTMTKFNSENQEPTLSNSDLKPLIDFKNAEKNQQMDGDLDEYKTANSDNLSTNPDSNNENLIETTINKPKVLVVEEKINEIKLTKSQSATTTTTPESYILDCMTPPNSYDSKGLDDKNNTFNSDDLQRRGKRLRKRRRRRQVNVPLPISDDEEDEFYHREYIKLRLTLDNDSNINDKNNNSDNKETTLGRLSYSQIRSLNYWTRFRMRKLGIDWKLKPIKKSYSMDI